MARIQAYVSDEVIDKISSIVQQRKVDGAKDTDISVSSVTTMLVELGLRVYEAQMERKADPFNQHEYNRVLLSNVIKTQMAVARVLKISTLASQVEAVEWLNDYDSLVTEIKERSDEILSLFFTESDESDDE
ncbi:conjugal transfer relaxosome DNA-binding protein TraM [Serratia bockelmannii]|uniref:Conjugal transfer relaxosome DNA-binding protein TraM n=1 Tax=Serratia bockelmannii TaxID=2703793 RepID=A0ABT8LX98_9GAMM|nr:conjugal transfer relaxosome DNA-binding protein TraM [Serratia bockelmannii]MDN6881930.1 conjugal transfer relaxosome DNA-binding protein TraM [Serratia bockelmannii]HBH6890285.1 relaxosome protein TraM [Serratia marcescens]